jgi:hypothetical protein
VGPSVISTPAFSKILRYILAVAEAWVCAVAGLIS